MKRLRRIPRNLIGCLLALRLLGYKREIMFVVNVLQRILGIKYILVQNGKTLGLMKAFIITQFHNTSASLLCNCYTPIRILMQEVYTYFVKKRSEHE